MSIPKYQSSYPTQIQAQAQPLDYLRQDEYEEYNYEMHMSKGQDSTRHPLHAQTGEGGGATAAGVIEQSNVGVPASFSSPLSPYHPTSNTIIYDGEDDGYGDDADPLSAWPSSMIFTYDDGQPITYPAKALVLQTLTTLSTIVFSVLPVVIKAGGDVSWGQWYTWKDGCRFIEPFCSGLLHAWFFYSSDLMSSTSSITDQVRPQQREQQQHHQQEQQQQQQQQQQQHYQQQQYQQQQHGDVDMTGLAKRDQYQLQQQLHGMTPLSSTSQLYGDRRRSSIAIMSETGDNSNSYGPSFPGASPLPPHPIPSRSRSRSRFKAILSGFFLFFMLTYATGAALHTAAAFFKNTIVLFLEEHSIGIGLSNHPLTDGDGQLSMALAQQLKEGYLLIQDIWEHKASHYMYAFGALGMSWCEMVAYSGQVLPRGLNLARVGHLKTSRVLKGGSRNSAVMAGQKNSARRPQTSSNGLVLLWIVAGVLYGGIVAGVACQYPKGLYVGSVYVVLLLLVTCGYILCTKTGGLFSLGRHYILQTYVIGGIVAAAAIVIYMAVQNFDMLTSNDKSHLGSITRP